ncbi:hypothetical protein AVEN_268797-1 [Araneus ventricosus]|uniref:Uncharacterized protein n=1 Tax=Araneus ventricosus TaxID=182803 RepID=A0A4Y2U2H5_ARAVE|nr:hypothetical protein AVEN_231653-1 [Araneus ventricosus]GBO05865.1 hypothetical protein AVEN_268797-1 [Araneus ventricosus]
MRDMNLTTKNVTNLSFFCFFISSLQDERHKISGSGTANYRPINTVGWLPEWGKRQVFPSVYLFMLHLPHSPRSSLARKVKTLFILEKTVENLWTCFLVTVRDGRCCMSQFRKDTCGSVCL